MSFYNLTSSKIINYNNKDKVEDYNILIYPNPTLGLVNINPNGT
ncbi:MAG: hypothetical protein R2831_01150 [Chitinophagaceae bacterium]